MHAPLVPVSRRRRAAAATAAAAADDQPWEFPHDQPIM
jgi:hypothetical protein